MTRRRATTCLNLPNVLLMLALWLLIAVCFGGGADASERCTWTDTRTGERWAVTVSSIAPGTAGIPWAWFTIDADPRRVFNVPAAELAGECRP